MDVVVLADISSGAYKFTYALHILAVMAGLGVTFWYGVYGLQGRKAVETENPKGAAAIAGANYVVSSKVKWVVYSIPLWGIGLVTQSDDLIAWGETWVWLSLVLFGVALVIAVTVLERSARRIATLTAELAEGPPAADGPPPQVAELDTLGRRMGMFSGINHLLVVVILYLMIWKPGSDVFP